VLDRKAWCDNRYLSTGESSTRTAHFIAIQITNNVTHDDIQN